MLSVTNIAAILVIVYIASTIRGFAGFGLALLAVPLLQFFMPVADTAVFIAAVNLAFSLVYFKRSTVNIGRQNTGILTLTTGLGVAIGAAILKLINPSYIQLSWGIMIIIIVVFMLQGKSFGIRSEKRALTLSGFLGGILAGSTGISGPPAAIILTSVKTPKERFNAILSVFILIAVCYALIFYLIAGLVKKETIMLAVASVPVMILGLFTGDILLRKVSQKIFTNAIYVILVIMGLLTIVKGLKNIFPDLF